MSRYYSMGAGIIGVVLGLGSFGCAAAQPTPQLVEAREAYMSATRSQAQEVAPDRVLEAKQALEQAEAAHEKDPGSDAETHYAYIAERKAELAMAHGDYAAAYRERQQAQESLRELEQDYRKQAEARLERTRDQLEETRSSLQRVRGEMEEEGDTKAELAEEKRSLENKQRLLEQELSAHQSALVTERDARQAAEERAESALASLKEVAQVKEEAQEMIITLSGAVLFKTGQSDLLAIAKDSLDRVAEALQQQGDDKKIVIEGHTDSRGGDEMNQRLSKERAESVKQYLTSRGIASSRIEAVGKGESEPIATNDTPEGRANNRRVEIIVRPGG